MTDDTLITVPCPKCGTRINQTVGWFRKAGNSCPGCGLRVAAERFKRAIEAAEKLLGMA